MKRVFVVLLLVSSVMLISCGSGKWVAPIENTESSSFFQFIGMHYWILFLLWIIETIIFSILTFPKQVDKDEYEYNFLFTNGNWKGRLLFIFQNFINISFFFIVVISINDDLIFSRFISAALIVICTILLLIISLMALIKTLFLQKSVTQETGRENKIFTTRVSLESYGITKEEALGRAYMFLFICILLGQVVNILVLLKTIRIIH